MFLYFVTALWWMTDAILERSSGDDLASVIDSVELPLPVTEVAGGAWPPVTRARIPSRGVGGGGGGLPSRGPEF